jgi:hypothetical protein
MDDIKEELEEKDIDIDTPKYIKLPLNFYLMPEIKALDKYPEKDRLIASWIKLLLAAAKFENEGRLQMKSNKARDKKLNPFDIGNHMFPTSVAYFIKIDGSKDVEEERKFALNTIDIFLKEGLLGRNDNPKEPYLFVKNWNDIYKASKPGKKTEWTKERVEEILKENDYNMTKTAKTIGNTKQFISFLAKKFGIKKPSKA